MALQITGAADPELIGLPWDTPLAEWPRDAIAALPRGISRHVVRFVRHGERVLAVKETNPAIAHREFQMLRELERRDAPCVHPVAVVTGRIGKDGAALEAALVTEHLQFSLPYRSVFGQGLRKGTLTRLVDALAVLLVRLHLQGFYWGDVSLSNALFRRDAAEFAAYLVDAETGDMHGSLTSGQRAYDIEIARTNIVGELYDVQAANELDAAVDPVDIGARLEARYTELWDTLTETETFTSNIPLRVSERVKALNNMGFDVGEIDMQTTDDGNALVIRPKVVDAGHHSRRLMRLTGLDVQENQARRLLNDLDEYAALQETLAEDESFVAHEWLTAVFEPTVRAVPREFRGKLEPAQVFHEVLDHRWYLAEAAGHDVPMAVAVASYVKNVLPSRPDEKAVLGRSIDELTAELPRLTAEVAAAYEERDEYAGDNTMGWGLEATDDASAGSAELAPPKTVKRRSAKDAPAPVRPARRPSKPKADPAN